MVMGMVRVIAKEFYNLVVEIRLEEELVEEGAAFPYHYKLAIEMVEGKRDCGSFGSMFTFSYIVRLFVCAYTAPFVYVC